MSKLIMTVVFFVAACVVQADVVIKNGATDWNAGTSYEGGVLPSANENVVIPAGATVTLDASDTASWNLVATLGRIVPTDTSSTLRVNVASGEVALSTPFSARTTMADTDVGELKKTGSGTLILGSDGKFKDGEGAKYDYYTAITVENGMLKLPQGVTTAGVFRYGNVMISEAATLHTITLADGITTIYPNMSVRTLTGTGILTGTSTREFQVYGSCTFAGKVTGGAVLSVSGRVRLTGTASDTTRNMVVYKNEDKLVTENAGGILEVMSFGEQGLASSVGAAAAIETGVYGGGVVYLGAGETTDKEFKMRDTLLYPGYNFIDGGVNGGLVWAGALTQNEWHVDETKVHRMVLMGSHTNECVMSGAFRNYTQGGNWYPIYIIKRGTGVWRMAHNADRTNGGGFAIEEGTLRYDSIAEAGTVCSLGKSDYLTENYTGRDLEDHRVDYAFLLGSASGGTMEYTGNAAAKCSTRPVAVKGKGGFKVSGSGTFDFSGFSPYETGAELVIETDRTDGNVKVSKITDGKNGEVISVTKKGEGTMTLDGELSFSGKLKVDAGTLLVTGYGQEKFTWFRWILKEKAVNCARYQDIKSTFYNSTADEVLRMQMQELALFDENGVRVNKNLAQNTNWTAVADLQPGQVTIEGSKPTMFGKLDELYNGVQWKSGAQWNGVVIYSSAWPGFVKSNPASWKTVVERLPTGSVAVASYDLGYSAGTNSPSGGYGITAFALEGSINGVDWTPLVDRDDCEVPGDSFRWLSSPDSDANTHLGMSDGNQVKFFDDHQGIAIGVPTSETVGATGTLANAEAIQVAAGATLSASGAVTVKGLTLDADGNGTIEGVNFAVSGVLSVEGVEGSGALSPPVTFVNCSNLANVTNWSVRINGKPREMVIKIGQDGLITLNPVGFVLMVK